MDATDIEALAVDFYKRLGFDPEAPVDTFKLARKLLGPHAIERGVAIIGLPSRLFVVRGERRIAINKRLSVPYARFFAGHELGHVVFDDLGYREDDLEAACDMFGAAVMAPLPSVRAMLRAFGRDHEAIADEVGSTQTWAALRIAEYLRVPRAVVSPGLVRVRGPEEWAWPDESVLRRWARRPAPGIRKARLTDDPRRVILDAEAVGDD